ncbi:MAG: hypothetical protein U0231_15745 [Nitrospiraceae bacterium]
MTTVYEHAGIYFQESKNYLLESRLQPRLKESRCRSYEDYLNFLRFDAYRDREFTGTLHRDYDQRDVLLSGAGAARGRS